MDVSCWLLLHSCPFSGYFPGEGNVLVIHPFWDWKVIHSVRHIVITVQIKSPYFHCGSMTNYIFIFFKKRVYGCNNLHWLKQNHNLKKNYNFFFFLSFLFPVLLIRFLSHAIILSIKTLQKGCDCNFMLVLSN